MMEQIEIIRSSRKTIAVEIKRDLRVIVRVPMRMKKAEIQSFLNEKAAWIEKHLKMMKVRNENDAEKECVTPFSEEEIRQLKERALATIPPRVEVLAKRLSVSYGKITIRNQLSRWASCSSKGNLNFNCLLMLFPEEVVDYVIIHELCHRKHMNHSGEFWAMVEKYCPEYKERKIWLKEHGKVLIRRLRTDD